MWTKFAYVPKSTKVDSPIDEALTNRQGVCQDFAHIMIALLRQLKVPARYVSGYLFHEAESKDRSSDGASHAWVEVLVPKLGWVAFDPTNNLIAGDRHIRVAIGRDYADVPPSRGVYKGDSTSELSVSVTVSPPTVRFRRSCNRALFCSQGLSLPGRVLGLIRRSNNSNNKN